MMSNTQKVEGHSSGVEKVVFSPDGSILASGSRDKTVKLWDVKTGELKQTLTDHDSWVTDITYSPDGRQLASSDYGKIIILWDANTGELKQMLTGHSGNIWNIVYSPDGNTLASASEDSTIKLWDANTGELKKTLTDRYNSIGMVAYSPDGRFLVSASDNRFIKLLNINTSELKNTFTGYSGWVRHITCSSEGKILVLTSDNNSIKLWGINRGELKMTFTAHSQLVTNVVYSPDGNWLASASEDSTINLWDAKTGELKNTLKGHVGSVRDVAYSPDGKTLASAGADHTVKLWDAKTGELKNTLASIAEVLPCKEESDGVVAGVAGAASIAGASFLDADENECYECCFDGLDADDGLSLESADECCFNMGGDDEVGLLLDDDLSLESVDECFFDMGGDDEEMPNQNVPVISQTQPLPHNGLFIRRNSAFGTKLSTSLKELIAQGVMVEQQNIRFDDFVAMKTSGIPLPTANHALAVSHGIAAIPAYQQRDNRATHYLEIALKTAEAAPVGHLEAQAPPVNYIFVVDVSGSMWGEKLDTVKASIRELFGYLRPDDVIGVIAFDDKVKTLLESTPKQNISPDDFGQIINQLVVHGSTDINLALSISIDEMKRYRGAQRVNQLFLFSDGEPTSGETNWIKIRQNIAAKLRQNTATDGNIRLSTFAFGTDANKVELDKLAGITGGQSTFVIAPEEDVRDSLQQELDRRSHLAAINVQMQINIDSDIEILHFYGHDLITDPAVRAAVEREADLTGKKVEKDYGVKPQPDLIKEDNGIRVFVPNLAAGETYWVVFELAVPEQYQSADFGNARVQYFDTFVCQNQNPQFDLSQPGPITPQWVAQHALGLWTSEVASYALYDVEANDLATAEKRIGAHISVLETAKTQLTVQTSATSIEQVALIDDIITLNKFLSLAQNMNKGAIGGAEVRNYLNYGLGELDRVRNGFVYRDREYSES
jgi:uncharacterized protein YegL/uncharacterized protein with WD repeat